MASKDKRSRKKQIRRENDKRAGHQIFVMFFAISGIISAYLLFWGLIIEPNIPRHIYGPGDYREFLMLLASASAMLISYVFIRIINYKPFGKKWLENMKLLYSVHFNLHKYYAFKSLGISYSRVKRKRRRDAESNNKSKQS